MDVRLAWTVCDEAGNNVVPNVLSPRDLVSRPDNMDENCTTHTHTHILPVNESRCANLYFYRVSVLIERTR